MTFAKRGFVASILLFLVFFSESIPALEASQQKDSQCVLCHTNLKSLIRLCWEVEKIKPKPKQSSETTGEG